VFRDQLATMAFCAKHNIVVEAYSALMCGVSLAVCAAVLIELTRSPLTHTEGPVRGVVGAIAEREDVAPEQVLIAWAKAKGAVVVTYASKSATSAPSRTDMCADSTSTKKFRLEGYLKAGDLGSHALSLPVEVC
jgi:diketogulonate reductase-like aldo/keto reductase